MTAEAGVRAAQWRGHRRVEHGEALHMHLVNDRGVQRCGLQNIVSPIKIGIDHYSLGYAPGIIPMVDHKVSVRMAECVAKCFCAPDDGSGDCLGIGIEQELAGIEPQTASWFVSAVDTVSVELPWPDLGH